MTEDPTQQSSVFISYARKEDQDDQFVKQLYEDLTDRGFRVWWDRECMPNRALKFTQEIRDAVESSDRLILIVGPRAVKSEYGVGMGDVQKAPG